MVLSWLSICQSMLNRGHRCACHDVLKVFSDHFNKYLKREVSRSTIIRDIWDNFFNPDKKFSEKRCFFKNLNLTSNDYIHIVTKDFLYHKYAYLDIILLIFNTDIGLCVLYQSSRIVECQWYQLFQSLYQSLKNFNSASPKGLFQLPHWLIT